MPNFPYTAWRLTPGFKPVECKVIGHGEWWGDIPYRRLATGGTALAEEIYDSKESAIAAGRQKVSVQEAVLAKKRASLDKKTAALNKAESAGK